MLQLPFSLRQLGAGLLVATVALLAACQDDTEDPSPSTELLTASPWHITAYTRASGSGAPTNYLTTMYPNACERDDRYTFKTTGVQERTEGATACSGSSPGAVVGTYPWDFNAAQTQLTIGSVTFDVVMLGSDTMQLRWTHSSGGVTYTDLVTYAN